MPSSIIKTNRLRLRPFVRTDIPEITRLLQDPAISETTLNIPYPYTEEHARNWLRIQKQEREAGRSETFAIVRKKDGQLLGAIHIRPQLRFRKAEIGYWIGRPFWGCGYATEAVHGIIRYGFETLALNRIYATHFTENPASGRVMQKAGMKFEGVLRKDVVKDGVFRDHAVYAILKEEWDPIDS